MTHSTSAKIDKPLTATVGAILLSDSECKDEILKKIARLYMQLGYRVKGYIQFEENKDRECCPDMFLEDIAENTCVKISQNLGKSATACRIDPDALARANARIESSLDEDTDLLILNRFGRSESDGEGLRSVIEKACQKEIPLLISVRPKYREQWEKYTAGQYQSVCQNFSDIVRWCDNAVPRDIAERFTHQVTRQHEYAEREIFERNNLCLIVAAFPTALSLEE